MSQPMLTRHRERTRVAFLSALIRLVIERGFDHITVTDIANEADYGRWTFYQYFESKEAAAWAAFEHWMLQLDQLLVASVQHLASPRREYESWRIIFRAFHEQRGFLSRLDSMAVSVWRVRVKEFLISQFLHHTTTGQFALMDGVQPEIAARLYVVALMELLEYWSSHPELGDSEAMADQFFTFIFNQPPPSPTQ